jgi:hypothetical protein
VGWGAGRGAGRRGWWQGAAAALRGTSACPHPAPPGRQLLMRSPPMPPPPTASPCPRRAQGRICGQLLRFPARAPSARGLPAAARPRTRRLRARRPGRSPGPRRRRWQGRGCPPARCRRAAAAVCGAHAQRALGPRRLRCIRAQVGAVGKPHALPVVRAMAVAAGSGSWQRLPGPRPAPAPRSPTPACPAQARAAAPPCARVPRPPHRLPSQRRVCAQRVGGGRGAPPGPQPPGRLDARGVPGGGEARQVCTRDGARGGGGDAASGMQLGATNFAVGLPRLPSAL